MPSTHTPVPLFSSSVTFVIPNVMYFSCPGTSFSSNLACHLLHSPAYTHTMTSEADLAHMRWQPQLSCSMDCFEQIQQQIAARNAANTRKQLTTYTRRGNPSQLQEHSPVFVLRSPPDLHATPDMFLFWGLELHFQQQENHPRHIMPKKSQREGCHLCKYLLFQ